MRLSNGLELTAEQESNLRKLAYFHLRGIEASPMGFDMDWYCSNRRGITANPEESAECGSVGCLVGHGPTAGVQPLRYENWYDYCERCFMRSDSDEWEWCFSAEWSLTDNTPTGGAKRILWLFEKGLPADWYQQQQCTAPLCYADWTPSLPPEIEEHVPERTAVGV